MSRQNLFRFAIYFAIHTIESNCYCKRQYICVLIRCTVSCTPHKEHGVLQTVHLVHALVMLQVCVGVWMNVSIYICACIFM